MLRVQVVFLLGERCLGLILPGGEAGPNGGGGNHLPLLIRLRGSVPWIFEWLFRQYFVSGYGSSSWWYCSPSLKYSEDVKRVPCRHIQCRSRPRVKKIGWDATCGTIGPVLWRLHNSMISQYGCAGGRLLVGQIVVGHNICGEFRNISIHFGRICWGRIHQWILERYPKTWCAHIRIDPSRFGDRSF